MGENVVAGTAFHIAEGDVPELHLAHGSGKLGAGGFLCLDVGLCLQNLVDALGAGLCPGQIQQGHGHHHHAHQYLEHIVQHRLQITQQEGALHDHPAAQIQHAQRGGVHGQGHNGHDGNDTHTHLQTGVHQLLAGAAELFPLIVFPDKGLHNPDGDEIFLKGVVQTVDALLQLPKQLAANFHNNANAK